MILEEKRIELDLSIKEVTSRLGIPYRTWQDWESGRRTPSNWVVDLIIFKLEKEKENEEL